MEQAICKKEELQEEGSKKLVTIGNKEIGIFNVGGSLYAVFNRCPHQAGPACLGGLFDDVEAEVTSDRKIREYVAGKGCVLACPWHGWEYDIRTGRCLWNPKYRLATYDVKINQEGYVTIVF